MFQFSTMILRTRYNFIVCGKNCCACHGFVGVAYPNEILHCHHERLAPYDTNPTSPYSRHNTRGFWRCRPFHI